MRSAGTTISGIAHAGLIVWLVAGWGFDSEPLPFEITEVSVVSGEEFAALVRATSPNPSDVEPTTPVVPDVEDTPPPPAPEDTPDPVEPPAPVEEPVAETPPPDAPEPPAPVTDVTDEVPEITSPDVVEQPEITEDITTETPNAAPAPVIAPDQIPQPETDAPVSVDTTPAVRPEEPVEDTPVVEPEEVTTTPDTAQTTSIENTEVSGAPETSIRPATRPTRPTPEEPPDEPVETASDSSDAINDLLADVVDSGESNAAAIEQGPPMTGSEKDSFRVAVNACWNVDTGAASANVKIVVGFSLDRDGKVEGNEVRQLSATGGSDSAIKAAYEAARRAILRCQRGGYDLPADKYGQWKDVEIEFDPSGMRLR